MTQSNTQSSSTTPNHHHEDLPTLVYRLCTVHEYTSAVDSILPYSAADQHDGYVHMSTAKQVHETAKKYYSHIHDVIYLLEIDLRRFSADTVRWDPVVTRQNELFAHYYGGQIDMRNHVTRHWKVEYDDNSKKHILPF
jgi:uncharacterized protein (DUF952 family)